MPEEGGWVEEFMIRNYWQWVEDQKPGILKHRPEEGEQEDYNKIPVNK